MWSSKNEAPHLQDLRQETLRLLLLRLTGGTRLPGGVPPQSPGCFRCPRERAATVMLPFGNQRWCRGRDSYKPPREPIPTREYEIAEIPGDRAAKAFIEQHHYAGTYPAARFRYGLYHRGALVGVAVFSHPSNDLVLTSVFPGDPLDSVELGRFVLLDSVPGNGETWFLARTFERLRRIGIRGVVSFSDPIPRKAADGRVIFAGHLGTIYQAHNAAYLGRSRPSTLRLLPDGSVLSNRALQKLRGGERGWRYVVATLVRSGATPPQNGESLSDWMDLWLLRLTRTLRHRGNHKYAWTLAGRNALTSLAYPKGIG